MKSQTPIIHFDENSYYSLLRSGIESWPKEVMGDVFGNKRSKKLRIGNAYPFITAERRPTSVSYGNNKAIERLRRLDKAVHRQVKKRMNLVGGYHSHVICRSNIDLSRKEQSRLSKDDLDFIKSEMSKLGKDLWVEVLLRIEIKDYLSPKKPGKRIIKGKRKLRIIVRDTPNTGYDITMSAYLIDKNLKVKELKITKD